VQGRHRLRPPVIVATIGMVLGLGLPATVLAAVSVDLDQWASSDAAWQNGNLNGNNSRYPEGGIVPFRLALEGLKPGAHSIHINYDFTAGGHKAYDFLATWNVTNAKGKVCIPSGGAISSMCPGLPGSSSAAFPSDPFKANGLSVKGAEDYSAAPRRLTIWGGTITSISAPAHAGSVNGNSTADIVVRFRSTSPAVLFAWGGHLAQSRYWDTAGGGARDGASLVSGAPWHMRTLQLDGAGNRNQDRSIQPSAIVGELPPQALAPTQPGAPATPRPPGAPATPRPRSAPNDPNSPAAPRGPLATVPPTSTVEPRVVTGSPTAALILAVALGTTLVGMSIASGWRRRKRPPD
jgi:hypothetical protein